MTVTYTFLEFRTITDTRESSRGYGGGYGGAPYDVKAFGTCDRCGAVVEIQEDMTGWEAVTWHGGTPPEKDVYLNEVHTDFHARVDPPQVPPIEYAPMMGD